MSPDETSPKSWRLATPRRLLREPARRLRERVAPIAAEFWTTAPQPYHRVSPSTRVRQAGAAAIAATVLAVTGTGDEPVAVHPPQAVPAPPPAPPAPVDPVDNWIDQARAVLATQGYPAEQIRPHDLRTIIEHESGGNPTAANNWDSNASAGTPSKGLMQTIEPTFHSFAVPGHTNIWNPVDNIVAGTRYSIDRYGSLSQVPGVVGAKSGNGYRGY